MTSLADINRRILKLQKQAEALRDREKRGVIASIRAAIEDYDISAAELGFTAADGTARRRGRRPADKAAAANPSTRTRRATKPSVIRYRDDAGHSWTGRGKRPNWFKEALAAGKTAEDLLVKSDDAVAGDA